MKITIAGLLLALAALFDPDLIDALEDEQDYVAVSVAGADALEKAWIVDELEGDDFPARARGIHGHGGRGSGPRWQARPVSRPP